MYIGIIGAGGSRTMKIKILAEQKAFERVCHDFLRALFGKVEFILPDSKEKEDLKINIFIEENTNLFVKAEVSNDNYSVVETVTEDLLVTGEENNQLKRMAKLATYRAVLKCCDVKSLPWGILTGIRPTKIVHRLLDLNREPAAIRSHMNTCYDLYSDKADELVTVALNNRKHILSPLEAAKLVSIYIGIPFCPTRCTYCSFPAYSIKGNSNLLVSFFEALKQEIKHVGKMLKENGLKAQAVYIGGGTPTTLCEKDLEELLYLVNKELVTDITQEITLEAGRPDTINKEKLKISLEKGVNRLSINPQTMNQRTLEIIGRKHSPEDIKTAFEMAKEVGFNNINMDIILGLPGEDISDVEKTLIEIGKLRPENVTVHTMAVKRASAIKESLEAFKFPSEQQIAEMLRAVKYFAENQGLHPYYLYRQKYMVSPMENIGYALKGFDCIYNIQVIEERQTILGLGAGAASKFVNNGDWTLTSFYNPKDPKTYIERIEELIEKKIDKLVGKNV